MKDKKYKIILVVLVFILLILIGILIYKTTKLNNNKPITTTTTTTTIKNLANNFNMFPLNDDSDITYLSVGDLVEADVDTETNFKKIKLKKGNLNYTANCKEYSEINGCTQVEFNINNTLLTVPSETTDGGLYLMIKNNNIVLVRFASTCAYIEIYRNSKLAYTVKYISTYNDTLLNYLKSKKEYVDEDDTIKYTNNKLYYLVDTIDGYTILKTIDLIKDTIKEEEVAKVKDNKKADFNCYNNEQV